ncbi:MAG TPA: putative metal-binding motif-containing protein [Solirubrobacteraceae bacterium]|nr:putative metal-binding motif-containing protein [Solirubrobacteraceae bacterium]
MSHRHEFTRIKLVAGLLAMLAALLVVDAAPAYAGDLRVRAHTQGAGQISYNFTSEVCDHKHLQDERVKTYCGQKVHGGLGHMDGTITATAATGDWSFSHWVDCPDADGNGCYMQAPFWEAGTFEPTAVFVDAVDPVFTLGQTQYPGGRSVSVPFTAHEALTELQCQLDHGGWGPCHSGSLSHYPGLSEGLHSLRVAGADASGQWGYSEVRQFTIVDTALTAPPGLVNTRSATFSFSTVGGNAFRCRVDGGGWFACASPTTVTVPTDGDHVFRVQAYNGALEDPDPATFAWIADTTPPDTQLDPAQGPPEDTKVQSDAARFVFGSEAGASFRCSVDGGAWQSCESPRALSGLAGGRHTFAVTAVDRAGNPDPTPSKRSWIAVVDKDSDGVLSDQDCNDQNGSVRPGAVDVPDNGIDEDCNGHDSVDYDRDRDGHRRPDGGGQDCNDANPAIHPGAADIPGNAVDEDCKDGAAPPEALATDVRAVWRVSGKRTQLVQLEAVNVSRGSTVTVTCKAKGKKQKKRCPKARTYTFSSDRARADIAGKLASRWFQPKTTIVIRVTKPGMRGVHERYETRKQTLPASHEGCLPAGAGDRC